MKTEADNIRLWASLRSLREPLSQRLSELNDEDRRRTLAENHIAGFLANPSIVSPPSNIEEDDDDYIGQEWIVDVKEVAGEIEAQGFRDEAEFLKQQCQRQFGQPDFSASNELEAVRNLLAFIDTNEVTHSGEVTKVGNTTQRPDDRPDGLKRPAFDVARAESQLEPSRQAVGELMARRQTIDELPGMAKAAYAVQRDDDKAEAMKSNLSDTSSHKQEPAAIVNEREPPTPEAETPDPIAESETKSVKLYGRKDSPIVQGEEKPTLTNAQYDVVLALLQSTDKGLTKDRLDRESKRGDARKILKRLSQSDSDWESVISFPGTTGKGYRII